MPGVSYPAVVIRSSVSLLVVAALLSGAVRANERLTPAVDEAAVRALLTRMVDAWNAGDADATAAPFIDDGEMISADGTHLRGRAEIARYNARLIAGTMQGSQALSADTGVRFLTSDVAIMRSRASFIVANQTAPVRHAVWSIVAIREGATWRVALVQSTHAAPPGPREAD